MKFTLAPWLDSMNRNLTKFLFVKISGQIKKRLDGDAILK